MQSDVIAASILATGTVIATLLKKEFGKRNVNNIKSLLALLELIPNDLSSKNKLKDYINDETEKLIKDSKEKRRDWFGAVLGVLFIVTALLIADKSPPFRLSKPINILASVSFLIGVFGIAEGLAMVERDSRGRKKKVSQDNNK